MADCNKLVPIIIRWEAGVLHKFPDGSIDYYSRPNEVLFEEARKKGYGNDPADAGGPTMVGVILDTYKAYCREKGKPTPTIQDLKNIQYEEWFEIFKTRFWDRVKADQIKNQSIANLCVNTIWGSGPGYIKIIQAVLGCKQDGIVGPVTLGKINGWQPQEELFDKLWARRKKFFENAVASSIAAYERKIGRKATERELMTRTNKRFINGWMNRLNSFKFEE